MLDKRKIRLMTRMALYEQGEGAEDMKISAYYKKDYVSMKMIATFIWTTIGYACAMLLILAWGMTGWMEELNFSLLLMLAGVVILGYLALLIITLLVTSRVCGRKHRDARMRMKRYNHGLLQLMKMYEKENQ